MKTLVPFFTHVQRCKEFKALHSSVSYSFCTFSKLSRKFVHLWLRSEHYSLLYDHWWPRTLRGDPRLHNSAFRAKGAFSYRLWGRYVDAMSRSGENQPTGEKYGFLAKKTKNWAVLPTFFSVTTGSIWTILVSTDAWIPRWGQPLYFGSILLPILELQPHYWHPPRAGSTLP